MAEVGGGEWESLTDEELECHFKWRPEISGHITNIFKFGNELLQKLEGNSFLKPVTYSLMGYLATLDNDIYDPDLVKKYLEDALQAAGEEEDVSFVAEANLLMHQKISGIYCSKSHEKEKDLLRKWTKWEKEDPTKLAFTYGCQGFALSKMGPNKIKEALVLYEKALMLQPNNFIWIAESFLLLKRIKERKLYEDTRNMLLYKFESQETQPHEYVLACQANYLITLHDESQEEMIEQILEEAKEKAIMNKNTYVLTLCFEGFKAIRSDRGMTECCEKLIFLSPESCTDALSIAAYMCTKQNNHSKAKEYLKRTIESASHVHVPAALGLIKTRIELDEPVDIDKEHQILLMKTKDVKDDTALVHENWAKSLKLVEPDRAEDILFHYRQAIKIKNLMRFWRPLKHMCQKIIRSKTWYSEMAYQQACRNLGRFYTVVKPQTCITLQLAKKYLSHLGQNSFEQDDIESYGKVLCSMQKYDDALKQFDKLENSDKKDFYQAQSYYSSGVNEVNNPSLEGSAFKDFLASAHCGCLDACDMALDQLELLGIDDHGQYLCCSIILAFAENPKSFTLEGSNGITRHSISTKINDILGITRIPELQNHISLQAIFKKIRKHLLTLYMGDLSYDLPTVIISETDQLENAKVLLAKSRESLDHLHHQLQQKISPKSTRHVYFPHLSENQIPRKKDSPAPGSSEAVEWSIDHIKKKFKNDFGSEDDRCRDLIEYIASRQPYSNPDYEWLYDAWRIVSIEKHQRYIVDLEVNIDDEVLDYVELARDLAFYADGMLQEYWKVLRKEKKKKKKRKNRGLIADHK